MNSVKRYIHAAIARRINVKVAFVMCCPCECVAYGTHAQC